MPAALPPNSIFLCYRRADSEVMVDRLYEELTEEFGGNAVFRDIDTIPAGVDFPTYIQQSLHACAVALVCIGRDWSTCADDRGVPRILDPDDHVRLEIETALALPHIRVIPLLVLHGVMPSSDAMPETLRALRRRNGITVRSTGADYRNDVAHLIRELRRSVTDVEAARRAEAEKERAESEAARRAAAEKEKAEREARRQSGEEKSRADREDAATEDREKEQSTGSDTPVVPKPAPSNNPDISTILLGVGQVIGSLFLLWLVVKGIEYVPKLWNSSPKVQFPGMTTPRFSSPPLGILNLGTPIPRLSSPGWLIGTPPAATSPSPLLDNRWLRGIATPTPAPASPTPRVLSPYDKWQLGTPRQSLEDTLRDVRTPGPATSPSPKSP